MDNNTNSDSTSQASETVDISELQNLSFGTSWAKSTSRKPSGAKGPRHGQKAPRAYEPRKDRRAPHSATRRNPAPKQEEAPKLPIEFSFYPEDAPFTALTRAIRQSCKTYELFEIAQLILEKPERFVVNLKAKPAEENPKAQLYYCIADKTPFLSEQAAVNHVIKHHLDTFFTTEVIEVDAPKGNFTAINKCGMTGALLGPSNYHLYQAALKNHHSSNLGDVSFDKFVSRITTDNTPESIAAWTAQMSQETHYTPKNTPEGQETSTFRSLEQAKSYLLSKHCTTAIKRSATVRFPGKSLENMEDSPIKQAIAYELADQRKFPLDTANNLRGRLRRMHFNIYKKGTKGISYVSSVKRKFRTTETVFAESIQKLVQFIDENPNINVSKLPLNYLNIEEVNDTVSAQPEMKQFIQDLRWLISEGYVIELGNGNLQATAVTQAPKPKAQKKEDTAQTTEANTDKSQQDKALESQDAIQAEAPEHSSAEENKEDKPTS